MGERNEQRERERERERKKERLKRERRWRLNELILGYIYQRDLTTLK